MPTSVARVQPPGTALFDESADVIIALSQEARDDMIEAIHEVTVECGAPRLARTEFFIVLTSADRLPPSFMAEPVAQA